VALVLAVVGRALLASTGVRIARFLFESADRALCTAKPRCRDRVGVIDLPCVSGVIRLDEHRAARKGRVSA
jgi:hypothetical protein